MRKFFDSFDYLSSEIGIIINLCEWIDGQSDDELSAALPQLHTTMHTHFDNLVADFNVWRAELVFERHPKRKRPDCSLCRRRCQ